MLARRSVRTALLVLTAPNCRPMKTCRDLLALLKPLSSIGEVVISGGAVRDEMIGRTPKDYDVFVLQPSLSVVDLRSRIGDILYGMAEDDILPGVSKRSSDDGSSEWIAGEFIFNDRPVQVIASQCASLRALLDTFDWNICRFGLSDAEHLRLSDEGNVCEGGVLKLNTTVTNPVSTLRRGFRFCDRYQMFIHEPDLIRLCSEVLAIKLQGESLPEEPQQSLVVF